MPLKVKDLRNLMENLAPANLKEDYDNVGLMVGSLENEVSNILVALDCTLKVIKEAKEKNCNFILTHHPLLFIKPRSVTDETLIGKKILELIRNDIALYSAHTNLDSVYNGLNDMLMKLLGFEGYSIMEVNKINSSSEKDGIGRLAVLPSPLTLIEICNIVKDKLKVSSLRYVGEDSKVIRKIAVVNGSGEDYYEAAFRLGADLIITGDTKYHNTSDFSEMGMAIIDAGHFESEWPAMRIFADNLRDELEALNYTNSVIISEASMPIYKYL
ncbi:Nif3-like dinuclear metal center hexameric protein [Candidatus Clostridium radicumherbarum]|uniref:GTP cyclohydrolase 1 type 2 homolog n=1 Tax=Candidatus Clostridium radicumherbarum TaxID=3381662 RepID=A0ABW8TQP5_9CLOT